MRKYSSVETPIGTIYAAASERGICSIGVDTTEREFLRKNGGAARDDAALAEPLDLVRRYLSGEDVSLKKIKIDLAGGTKLQRAVWQALRKVPRGTSVSYSQLAAAVGRPRACRAIGNIVGANPVPVVVPCHRVIRADGTLGGFGCGIDIKKYLLETVEKVKTRS